MDAQPQGQTMPKKSCMITVMFAIENDSDAMVIKEQIDKILADINSKRYTFQINEV